MITLKWYHSEGTQEERPNEIDLTSAPVTSFSKGYVYLRKNIRRIEKDDPVTEETYWVWDYDEAVLPRSDYAIYLAEKAENKAYINQANIDFIAMMTDIELEED